MEGAETEVLETRTSRMRLGTDGVMRSVVRAGGGHVTLADAQRDFGILGQMAREQKRPMLADIRNLKSVDRAARKYAAGGDVDKMVCAMAIVVGSTMTKVIGSLYLGFNRPPYPTRLFTGRDAALAWLRTYVRD